MPPGDPEPGSLLPEPARLDSVARQTLGATVTWAAMKKLRMPALLLTGEADLFAPPPLQRMVAAHLPKHEMATLREVGHAPYWEDPVAFNRLVLAFLRRLRFIVTFPYPGVIERQAIWQRAFPPAALVGNLDWAHLGRLNLTGGNIATVALNAAFLASADDAAIEMHHVLAAARAEYVKLDRPFRESDFLVELRSEHSAATQERVA